MKIKTAKIVAVAFFIIASVTTSLAQTGTSSAYSRFGIGDLEQSALGQSLGLAGTGIGLRTPYEINPINPASYSAFYPAKNLAQGSTLGQLKYPNFMFQVGIRMKRTSSVLNEQSTQNYNYGLRSMATGFHINKYWSASVGLMPYSSIGYSTSLEEDLFSGAYDINIKTENNGSGGLNRIYFGNAFKYKQFALGFNANYIFGNQTIVAITTTSGSNYKSTIASKKNTDIRGLIFDFGAQFTDTIAHKFVYTIGGIYNANSNINAFSLNTVQQLYTINGQDLSNEIIRDTTANGSITIPQMYGAGFSIKNDKWLIAADYKTQAWSSALFLGKTKPELTNSTAYSLSTEFTPDITSDFFFKQISYRLGVRYSDYYIKINDA